MIRELARCEHSLQLVPVASRVETSRHQELVGGIGGACEGKGRDFREDRRHRNLQLK